MTRFTALAALLLLVGGSAEAVAQRRAPAPPVSAATELAIVARIGSQSSTARLSGSCKHEPSASIYDVPAALYTVEAQGTAGSDIKQVNLTLWRPKNGTPDQISVALTVGSSSARVEVNPRTPAAGTATVELRPVGSGGTFQVKGKDGSGKPIQLTIECPEFAAVEAAGG
jgi:hypothetical protein